MKNLKVLSLILIGSFILCNKTSAQVELKVNPIFALFEIAHINIEKQFRADMSFDFDIVAGEGGVFLSPSYKYFFNPTEKEIDKFYISAFLPVAFGFEDDFSIGLGFGAGYKFISRRGVVFEIGAGIGRGTGNIFLPYPRLGIGYRFGKKH